MEAVLLEVISKITTDTQNINQYTEQIKQLSKESNFTPALIDIVSTTNNEDVRVQAMIIFKNHVKLHWAPSSSDSPVLIPADIKPQLRARILSLPFTNNKVFTDNLATSIAMIARHDYPLSWPEFLPTIAARLNSQNPIEVAASLACFNIVVGLTEFNYIIDLYSNLAPLLKQFCQSYESLGVVSLDATQIFRSFCYAFGSHPQEKQTGIFISDLAVFIDICITALKSTNIYGLVLASRIICDISTFFPSALAPYSPIFNATIIALKTLRNFSIEGMYTDVDSEGSVVSVGTAVFEIFQYLEEMFTRKASEQAIAGVAKENLKDLLSIVIAFLQINEAEELEWMEDITAFVLSESSFGCIPDSPRINAQNLLNSLCSSSYIGQETLLTIQSIAADTIITNLSNQNNDYWWRLVEAALVAVGIYATQLQHLVDECELEGKPVPEFAASSPFLASLSTEVLTKMITMNLPPLLLGRVLIVSSQTCSFINEAGDFFNYAVNACASEDMLSRVCGCQALTAFVKRAPEQAVLAHINSIVPALLKLIDESVEDLLSFAIETLGAIAKAVPSCANALEEVVSPLVIKVWSEHNSDPLSAISAAELLTTIVITPEIVKKARNRLLLPMITAILNSRSTEYGIITSGLTFVETLVKGGRVNGAPTPLEHNEVLAVAELVRKIVSEEDATNINSILILLPDILNAGRLHLETPNGKGSLLEAAENLLQYVVTHLSDVYTGIGRILVDATKHQYVDAAFINRIWHTALESVIGNLIDSQEPYLSLMSSFARAIAELIYDIGIENFANFMNTIPTVHGGAALKAAYQVFAIGGAATTTNDLSKKLILADIPLICEYQKQFEIFGINYYTIDEEIVPMPLPLALLALATDLALGGEEDEDDQWMDLDEMMGCDFYEEDGTAIDKDHPLFKADFEDVLRDTIEKMKIIAPDMFSCLEEERYNVLLE